MEPKRQPEESEQGKSAEHGLALKITTISWGDLADALVPILLISAVAIWLTVHFTQPETPRTLTMSGGPPGSSFAIDAERFKTILARSGVTLHVLPSRGSAENLQRLSAAHSKVDIALVRSTTLLSAPAGAAAPDEPSRSNRLVSLGSMFYQPLTIFYRGPRLQRLAQLRGERIAIGKPGSGARQLALALLKANGIVPGGPTRLLGLTGTAARAALLAGRVDAIFLTGNSTPPPVIDKMLRTRGIRLFAFTQANAYVRRFPLLHKLSIPAGTFDLARNLPRARITLLAAAVELIAHKNLRPALCDLLIQTARRIYGRASVLHAAREFPNTSTYRYPLDRQAARYYKTGDKGFMYRYLPFWLASLLSRLAVVMLPIVVVLIPGLAYVPQLYGWRVKRRIHRRYAELMALERESLESLTPARRLALLDRLHAIERAVILRRMPGSHAEQLYQLRARIRFVREILARPVPD